MAKPLNSKQLLRKITRGGSCEVVRQKGSHATVQCAAGCQTVVPMHAKELKRGTQRGIEKRLEPCLPPGALDGVPTGLKLPKGSWVEVAGKRLRNMPNVRRDWYKLIEDTYRPIGGHVDFSKPDDLIDDIYVWDAIDIDDDPQADVVASHKNNPYGRKLHAIATDQSPAAKAAMMDREQRKLHQAGNYAEVSDAMAHVLLKRTDVPVVQDEQLVRKVLKGKKIKWLGCKGKYPGKCGWYSRTLGGKPHDKIMVGIPRERRPGGLSGMLDSLEGSTIPLLFVALAAGLIVYDKQRGA